MHKYMFPQFLFAEDDGGGSGEPQAPATDGDTGASGAESQTQETFDPSRAQEKIRKLNSESSNLRERLKAAEEKVAEFEGASKSDIEKLNEKATTLEQRAAKAEAEALRLTVAFEKGLTPKQAARLVGSTQEELEADADELLETFGSQTPRPAGNGRVAENLRQSGAGEELPEETDPAKLAALHPRR